VTHRTDEQQQATLHRDLALRANFDAMRLQVSAHALDREGAGAAYEVAQLHHAAWIVLSGRFAPGVA
jgi:hypothetical protein